MARTAAVDGRRPSSQHTEGEREVALTVAVPGLFRPWFLAKSAPTHPLAAAYTSALRKAKVKLDSRSAIVGRGLCQIGNLNLFSQCALVAADIAANCRCQGYLACIVCFSAALGQGQQRQRECTICFSHERVATSRGLVLVLV